MKLRQRAFLSAFRETCTVVRACEVAKVGRSSHYRWLADDPDPVYGWQWFFEQMMLWENKDPALLFGQQYLAWLLQHGDEVAAVKLMMRCRLEDEAFKPLPEDRALAREAAEHCRNDELVKIL